MLLRLVAPAAFLAASICMPLDSRAAEVATLAGSGLAGFADGPAAVATFLMPEGLALAPSGDVYVADAAAQRIRRVTVNGTVSTIAGSGALDASRLYVPGGHHNGPAASARFDQPAAVAVTAAGDVVVADTGNHCLRLIKAGLVSDYAGVCGTAGSADGTRSAALFEKPLSLAFDGGGSLYVADYGTGIRRIAPDGTVSTIDPGPALSKDLTEATGLSYSGAGPTPVLYVAARAGMFVLDAHASGELRWYRTGVWDASDPNSGDYVAGTREFGHPYAVAAVDGQRFAYTDIATDAVRFFTTSMTNVAIGSSTENAGFEAGAFRDGAGNEARVNQPMGIVRRPNGTFVIADAGNRRVRTLSGIDFRMQTSTSDLSADRTNFRIVYIGDSAVNSNQAWNDSISGILERNLRSNWQALGFPRPPRVYPIEVIAGMDGTRDYVDTYLAAGLADMVILQLTSGQVSITANRHMPLDLVPDASQWQPVVTSAVRSIASELAKVNVPLVVALSPVPYEVSPSESGWMNLNKNATYVGSPGPTGDYERFGPLLHQAVEAAGVPVVDAFPAFAKVELAANHPALFAAADPHFSVAGAALNAQVILDYLLRTRPWKRTRY